jgi:hypothetical protein
MNPIFLALPYLLRMYKGAHSLRYVKTLNTL